MNTRKLWTIVTLVVISVSLSLTAFWVAKAVLHLGEIKVLDQAGRTVYVPRDVKRIVSLWPEATRVIIALGAGDRLVGIDSPEHMDPVMVLIYPRLKDLPVLGTLQAGVNVEQLISLKPDVIFADARLAEAADDLQKKTGIPVVCVRISLPPDGHFSFELITLIGECLGVEDRASEVRDFLEEELSKVTNVTSKIPEDERVRGYVAFARDPLTTLGHVDPLESAGVVNVAAKGFKLVWYAVNVEQLMLWNPDIIIVHCLHERLGNYTVKELLEDPAWRGIKAVKEGRVYNIILGFYGWYPATCVINVMQIAKAAYPQLFEDLDVIEEGNRIYKFLYGVDGFFTRLVKMYDLYVP